LRTTSSRVGSENAVRQALRRRPAARLLGLHQRYRLNRGGDRAVHSALYVAIVTRMRTNPKTQAYVARRTSEGKSKLEIIRCLKRYVAREAYYLIRNDANPRRSAT
jgi:transposase